MGPRAASRACCARSARSAACRHRTPARARQAARARTHARWLCGRGTAPGASTRSAPIAVADGPAPVGSEGAFGDLDPGWRLAALVLGAIDQVERVLDGVGGQTLGDQLLAAEVQLDVAVQNTVEHVIWRQRVLVALARAKLGGGRALEDRGGKPLRGAAPWAGGGGCAPPPAGGGRRRGRPC